MSTLIDTSSTEIIVSGLTKPSIEIRAEIIEQRNFALQTAENVLTVANEEDQKAAVGAMSSLRSIQKGIESSREMVKKPVLEIGRLIDGTAKDFIAPVSDEIQRLSRLISKFQDQERVRVEKIRREQEEIRRKALEEDQKKQQEIAAQAASAKTPVEVMKALQAQEAQEQNIAQTISKTVQVENQQVATRVSGMVVRRTWKFEVTDVKALFAAKPDFVIMEANGAAIRGMISAGLRECPGLRIFEDVSTTVRA